MNEDRTVWCGNISDKVTEDVLFELFLQAAPVERVKIPTDKEGRKSNFAFVTFKHNQSVDYAVQLLNGMSLFDRKLNIRPRNVNHSLHRSISDPAQQMPNVNHPTMMNNYNDLMKLGEMMHLGHQINNSHENWHSPYNQFIHREQDDRRKHDYQPYNHHDNRGDRYHNYHSQSNSRQGQNYGDHRNRRSRQY